MLHCVQGGVLWLRTVWFVRVCSTTGYISLASGGGRPPGFNSLWRGWVYRPMPEAPLFKRGMPTGPDAFLELPVVLSFGSATGPALKIALCHILTLVGRRINTARMQFWKIWSVFEFCHKTIEVYHRIRRLRTKDREFYVPTSKWLRLFSNKA